MGAQTAQVNAEKKAAGAAFDEYAYRMAAVNSVDYAEASAKGHQKDTEVKRATDGSVGTMVANVATGQEDQTAYNLMSADERGAYDYYAEKNPEIARRYLESLNPQLVARAAEMIDQNIENVDNEAGKKVVRFLTTIAGASKNVQRKFQNIPAAFTGSEAVVDPGMIEQGQRKMAQRLEGIEKVVNDVGYNTVNFLPSAAVSMIPVVGPAAAAAMTGVTTYSGTYADTVAQGYTPEEAMRYAIPAAASEALLQRLMGGIAKTGGTNSLASTIERAAGRIAKNPAAAKGLSMLGNMGSEGAEEYIQANIDPILRNAILNEDNEIDPFSEDKLYAAVLGTLSSLATNAPMDIADASRIGRTGKTFHSLEMMQGLMGEGLQATGKQVMNGERNTPKLDALLGKEAMDGIAGKGAEMPAMTRGITGTEAALPAVRRNAGMTGIPAMDKSMGMETPSPVAGRSAGAMETSVTSKSMETETPVLDGLLGKERMDGIAGRNAERATAVEGSAGVSTPRREGLLEAETMRTLNAGVDSVGADGDVANNTATNVNPAFQQEAIPAPSTQESQNSLYEAGARKAEADPAAEIMEYFEGTQAEQGREMGLDEMMEDVAQSEKEMSIEDTDAAAREIMEEMGGERKKFIVSMANEMMRVLDYKPSSGVELKSTPAKTTTILGRYWKDTKNIIGELDIPQNTDFNRNIGGFNLLNTPDECYTTAERFWDEYNKPFLDAAIDRGDEILMSTPITYDNLYLPGSTELTGYGREYFYLIKHGYKYENGKMILERVNDL